jgi:hypothetical protein
MAGRTIYSQREESYDRCTSDLLARVFLLIQCVEVVPYKDFTDKRQSFRPSTPNFSEDGSKKQAWELSIWDPAKFSLNTFW